jgi:hypothetical protein
VANLLGEAAPIACKSYCTRLVSWGDWDALREWPARRGVRALPVNGGGVWRTTLWLLYWGLVLRTPGSGLWASELQG